MRRRRLLAASLLALAPAARATVHPIEAGGGRIELHFDASFDAALIDAALPWAQRAANAIVGYLGRLPLRRFDVLLQAQDGAGLAGGTAFPEPEPHLRIRLGRQTRAAQFSADWILVHEMLHLAVPQVGRPHRWLHEGIATYAEGAARVLAGMNDAPRWWGELVRGLPQGLPQAGDRGLDHTPTWGRTYWGGALFCLVADVRMRRHNGARTGLREALQGVLAAGGNYRVAWPVERILAAGDAAVGQTVLRELYDEMKDRPVAVDLDAMWRELGVTGAALGRPPRLDDDAPLAAVRRAIALSATRQSMGSS